MEQNEVGWLIVPLPEREIKRIERQEENLSFSFTGKETAREDEEKGVMALLNS